MHGMSGLCFAYGYNSEALPSMTSLKIMHGQDRTQQLIPNRLRKL
jgi:hypothetical protein